MSSAPQIREPSVNQIRTELDAVLGSTAFRHSRGLARLLKYICGRALVSSAEPITEYTIAVDVLGKPADFKESKESNVRVEVHRLRKRLAQFYEEEGTDHPLRIVIPTGQYSPQFLFAQDSTATDISPSDFVVEPAPPPVPAMSEWQPSRRVRPGLRWLAIPVLVGVACVLLYNSVGRPEDPLDAFWRPVFATPNQVLLCIGNLEGGLRSRSTNSPRDTTVPFTVNDFHGQASQMVNIADAVTATRLAGLLQGKGKSFRLVSQTEATFADLLSGPAVLIGLLNNDWTERLVEKLRFTVERRTRRVTIRDRNNPQREDWSIDYSTPLLELSRDYALVLRLVDPKTEQMVVTAAGVSVFGTLAAGEFLTNPAEIRKLVAVAPKDWKKKNFELVLSTEVIRGKSGRASIVAAHFW